MHCGFCLPTCPTYQLWGEEMDSPRGRIYLMNLAEKGEIGLDGPFTRAHRRLPGLHGLRDGVPVRACSTTGCWSRCARSSSATSPRTPDDRLFREAIFALFPYKRRLRAAALPGALYQQLRRVPAIAALAGKLPGRLGGDGVAAAAGVGARGVRPAARAHPGGRRPGAAGWRCCPGCVQDVFFHRVNEATVRVLAAEGYDVLVPRDQQCCGALELHAGREEQALAPGPARHRACSRPWTSTTW